MQFYYSQIPALKTVPKSERYRTYRSAHKTLMKEDAAYRRHWDYYFWMLIAVVVIGFLSDEYFPAIRGVVSFVRSGIIIALVLWQQDYMNRGIDAYLSSRQPGS